MQKKESGKAIKAAAAPLPRVTCRVPWAFPEPSFACRVQTPDVFWPYGTTSQHCIVVVAAMQFWHGLVTQRASS